jgi:hypothetical protein
MVFRWQITPIATWVGYDHPLSLAFSQSGKPGIAWRRNLPSPRLAIRRIRLRTSVGKQNAFDHRLLPVSELSID